MNLTSLWTTLLTALVPYSPAKGSTGMTVVRALRPNQPSEENSGHLPLFPVSVNRQTLERGTAPQRDGHEISSPSIQLS